MARSKLPIKKAPARARAQHSSKSSERTVSDKDPLVADNGGPIATNNGGATVANNGGPSLVDNDGSPLSRNGGPHAPAAPPPTTAPARNTRPPTHKKRRWRPGTAALREIRKFQKSADLIIPKAPFSRLVREILQDLQSGHHHKFFSRNQARNVGRWSSQALLALQEATKSYLIDLMSDGQLLAINARRITIKTIDLVFVRRIRNNKDAFDLNVNNML